MAERRLITFTDMDGTLLEHYTYSFKAAKPALKVLRKAKIPLVMCTSKTKAEIEYWRKKLKNTDPFIVEDGGAIYIPRSYFSFDFEYDKIVDDYFVIELGTPYKKLRQVLRSVKNKTNCEIVGFGDMSIEELAAESGLGLHEARLAQEREYDEPFKISGWKKEVDKVLAAVRQAGLTYTAGGRYFHIMGANDKGKAVKILSALYKKAYGDVETIALGDSLNDLPMLKAADRAFLVQKPDGSWDSQVKVKKVKKVDAPGPAGWNKAVSLILK